MRSIDKIIIHCAATYPGQDIGAAEITCWHLDNGYHDIGYHGVIRRDGTLDSGRPLHMPGAHTKGHNAHSVGICLVGGLQDGTGGDANADGRVVEFENGQRGVPEANYTPAQWAALTRLVRDLVAKYPGATVHGHNEFANKACPCFDVRAWWAGVCAG
jgi:Negative regulator of beta-lactamase expression